MQLACNVKLLFFLTVFCFTGQKRMTVGPSPKISSAGVAASTVLDSIKNFIPQKPPQLRIPRVQQSLSRPAPAPMSSQTPESSGVHSTPRKEKVVRPNLTPTQCPTPATPDISVTVVEDVPTSPGMFILIGSLYFY